MIFTKNAAFIEESTLIVMLRQCSRESQRLSTIYELGLLVASEDLATGVESLERSPENAIKKENEAKKGTL